MTSSTVTTSSEERSTLSTTLILVGHLCRLGLAGVFLLAVATKIFDPGSFVETIAAYGVTPAGWAAWQAPFFLMVETALGLALLVNVRPRLTLIGTGLLLAFFIVVIAIAVSRGFTGGCGCFGGAGTRTPQDTMIEDVLFLLAVGVAYLGMRARNGFRWRGRHPWQMAAVALGLMLGLLLPLVGPQLPMPAWSTPSHAGGHLSHVVIQEYDGKIDEGNHLFAILRPGHEGSVAAVDPLNALVGEEGVPSVVGVFEGTNEEMIEFLFEHGPAFDGLGHSSRTQLRPYYRRLPVVLGVRDGVIVGAWHESVPSVEEVREAFSG